MDLTVLELESRENKSTMAAPDKTVSSDSVEIQEITEVGQRRMQADRPISG